ncbi:MAG TPA: restriction endonuclease subunit S [Chloroflexi bacterium]|nr:restriction endonuclease subunit S [Chloroflexota bacterium]
MAAEWRRTTIGSEVTLQRGFDITKKEQRPGKVPVVSSSGISSYHDTYAVPGPGVVLGRKGTLGTVFYLEGNYWPHDTTLWVKDFHGNDPKFAYYFFKSLKLSHLDVGSANPTLNRNHVHPIEVLWPPLPIQRRIAEILGALDDKIEVNRRINRVLEAMAQALYKHWFVDFGPFQDGEFVESAVGLIPKGWRVGSVLEQAELLSGGTPKTSNPDYWGGRILWSSAKDVSQCGESFLLLTERSITPLGFSNSSTKMIDAFSTVVVARGATTGRLVLFGTDMAMNQTCYALRSRAGCHFTLYCQMRHIIEGLVRAAHGSVFNTITTDTFKTSRVLLPPEPILSRFETQINPIFQMILTRQNESRTLAATRDYLLPKLLSGEISVEVAEGVVAQAV